MHNIFTPYLSYSPFPLFFFILLHKYFFHQSQKPSNPTISKPPISQSTPIHSYSFSYRTRIKKKKKKSHKARPTLYSPSSLSILETRRKLQILFLHRIAYPPWNGNELDPTSASLDKPLFCW